ncbi:hypothetical protein V1477_014855 [Vespula maculifrons]|uniref:Uncharacterized protein n=1 Tax=Vespula maculifrons TaxID=7453 RepID=A0ABD2BJ49_VESMC
MVVPVDFMPFSILDMMSYCSRKKWDNTGDRQGELVLFSSDNILNIQWIDIQEDATHVHDGDVECL